MAKPLVIYLPDAATRPYWPKIHQMLEPAAQLGGCAVLDADDLVWVAVSELLVIGAVTTRLLTTGEAEVKHIAGTRLQDWFGEMESMICAWARACGAWRIVSRGRKGWARVNRAFGWKVTGMENGLTLYEKAL